jgi:quercetin dioxygenase-like cupin family protein
MMINTADTTSYTWFENLAGMMADIQPESIISRTIYRDAQVNVSLFGFAAGQSLSEHTASQPALIHILQGEGTLALGDDVKQVQAGSWVRMAAHLKHCLAAKTPLTMLLILLKS